MAGTYITMYLITAMNYDDILNDLNTDEIDIALCSIWFSYEYFQKYDLSTYLDYQCVTSIVPRSLQNKRSIFYIFFFSNQCLDIYFVFNDI